MKPDKTIEAGNRREITFRNDAKSAYAEARKRAVKDLRPFLEEMDALDREEPPVGRDKRLWRQEEREKLIRKHHVRDRLLNILDSTAGRMADAMEEAMADIAEENAVYTLEGETEGGADG